MRLVTALIDLFYPPVCLVCTTPSREPLCQNCISEIKYVKPPVCDRCGYPTVYEVDECNACRHGKKYYSHARSLGSYDGVLGETVRTFKYKKGRRLGNLLAHLLIEHQSLYLQGVDLITFVPLRPAKERRRGYNQAELVARSLSRHLELPVRSTIHACRNIQDQSKLDSKERQKNVKNAFQIKDRVIPMLKDKQVLLVDDVLTTGSTINECAKQLAKSGCREVKVLTIARTV